MVSGYAAYVKKFGLNEKERQDRRTPVIKSRIEDITRKNTAKFDAYELLISQQGIQLEALKDLQKIFTTQINAKLESVVVGKPDFIDDGIEVADSRVVAAKKKQEEEGALKKAAETRIERLKIEVNYVFVRFQIALSEQLYMAHINQSGKVCV